MKKYLKILLFLLATTTFGQKLNLPELKKIEFSGNEFFSDVVLGKVVALRESPSSISQFLNDLIGIGDEAVYFDSLLIGEELLRLKSYYFNHGFFQSQIDVNFTLDTTENFVQVVFEIIEGSPTYYNNLSVHGIKLLPKKEKLFLKSFSKIDTTQIYSYTNVSSINSNMVNYLKNNGYMFATIDSTFIHIDTLKNIVDTDIFINVGKKYSISDIVVKKKGDGKDEVDSKLITEITGIKDDELYSKYKINLGQSRLYKTNLFTIASVKSLVADTSQNKVPLMIETEIGKMYEITPEVIMNNEDNRFNLGLGAGFSKKNFFGGARILTLNASIAAQNILEFISNISVADTSVIGYADLRLILQQPFLFEKNIDTRYELYTTLQKRRDEYNTTAQGFKVKLDFELPQYVYLTSFGTSWNLERLDVLYQESYLQGIFKNLIKKMNSSLPSDEVDSVATELTNSISKSTKSINTLITFDFGANKTNNFGFPTNGYKLNLLLANANFSQLAYSKIFNKKLIAPLYYKVQIDFNLFPPIYSSEEDAFGIKFRVGNIQVYDGLETSVPYNQRFTSGGSNSIRGWQSRELVPKFNIGSIDMNSISPVDLEAIFLDQAAPGGLFLFEGSIETRNRLLGKIGGALFLDYGNTWQNIEEFRFDEIAISAGFGLRYYTDFIPFRIDFGIKIYDPNSTTPLMKRSFFSELFQLHFAIGEAF